MNHNDRWKPHLGKDGLQWINDLIPVAETEDMPAEGNELPVQEPVDEPDL